MTAPAVFAVHVDVAASFRGVRKRVRLSMESGADGDHQEGQPEEREQEVERDGQDPFHQSFPPGQARIEGAVSTTGWWLLAFLSPCMIIGVICSRTVGMNGSADQLHDNGYR
jgi:hypothetical protein